MILKILRDKRLREAMDKAEAKSNAPWLDILKVVLENLDEILAVINNPAALLALILKLLSELS